MGPKQTNQHSNQKQQKQQDPRPQSSFHKTSNKKANQIISKCLEQNILFKKFHQIKNWKTIHSSHYDWWAFPIDERSSYGDTYMVESQEINFMKNSKQFMQILSENAQIVCEAWGYDLLKGQLIKTQLEDQKWHNWPIRLYKMTRSLQIFELQRQFQNAVKYGNMLLKMEKNFTYSRRDLGKYFQQKLELKLEQKCDKKQIEQRKQREQKEKRVDSSFKKVKAQIESKK